MAAFSSFHHHLDSSSIFHLPNTPSTINELITNMDSVDHSTKVNDYVNKNSMDSSSIVTPYKKRKSKEGSFANCAQSKEVKGKKQKKMIKDGGNNCDDQEKKEDDELQRYIHVRSRRGQATDSHSLAERVRRERISERMKLLQSLVPGCEKVTGKALMLDEIINYVQSLQNQVEFLSMKIASVNPMFYDFGMDLESLMVRPDQQCSPTTVNNYYALLDNAPNSLMFQQSQIPNTTVPQGHIEVVWEVDEQRQKIINQSGISNTLFSFH